MNATTVVAQHAADLTAGRLTGSQRMKLQILRDIALSPRVTPKSKKDAESGLAQWESTARAHGFASLAAWEAVR
jgi:hypothetical protein